MKLMQALCPKCGKTAGYAEHNTIGSHSLDATTLDDGSLDFEWGDQREDNAECDESPCIVDALRVVAQRAASLVSIAERLQGNEISDTGFRETILQDVAGLRKSLAALRGHEHGDCLTLHCDDCSEDWHSEIIRD